MTLRASLIVLNGASCVGKSTIAHELYQTLCAENHPVAVFSVDDMYPALEPVCTTSNELDDLGEAFELLFAVWHDAIFDTFTKEPNSTVIVDHCLSSSPIFEDFTQRYHRSGARRACWVKVYCSYTVAEQRLKHRNESSHISEHRYPHSLIGHFSKHGLEQLHGDKKYDVFCNTSSMAPQAVAGHIVSRIHDTPCDKGMDVQKVALSISEATRNTAKTIIHARYREKPWIHGLFNPRHLSLNSLSGLFV